MIPLAASVAGDHKPIRVASATNTIHLQALLIRLVLRFGRPVFGRSLRLTAWPRNMQVDEKKISNRTGSVVRTVVEIGYKVSDILICKL